LSWQLDRRTADYARIGSNLNKAIETSLDAIVITDSNGKTSTYNTAAQSMFGFTLAEVKGILIEDLLNSGPKTPGRRRLDGRQIAAKLARSANRGRIRLKLQKSDGTDFMVEAAIASDVDSEGQPIFLGFLRDISKLVKAHDNERAARFEAERSAAASARFLAVMSHEMRTPLHGIIAALDLLDGAPTPKEIALLRNIARDSAGAALEQIEEVLELALHDAMDESEVIMTFFPFEVSRIIVEQWQSLAAASHTSLTLVYDPAMSEPMLGNRRAFRSAVGNLVGNAIKFTKNGTITLRLYPTPDVPHHMRVEVTDTGIGIEPQHLTRIFNDFETVSGPSLAKFSASGLGLGIVRRAVGLMGGTLQLESTFGKGSRFWFDIPQSSALLARADKQPALPHVPLDPALTVLVVDDNAINRLLLAQMLERLGHTVELADDGVVAVEAAAHKRYDMILMDINMPGMNGVEATRMIRAGGASRDVPIMGVTANALPQDLALFVMAGLNCTMIKPITSAALALQMRQLTGPQAATPSPVAQPDVPPLMAVENFRDLRDVMDPAGFAAILAAALDDVGAALSDARGAPPSTALAGQIHGAAGPAALIGANRLHLVLCDLENATRRNQTGAMESLLDDALSAWQDTADWIKAALL
ncbi:MAG: response regulator, partial [Pseudorhodobacter sp.]|nr:response regulator [Pseudorhodobacter sp.]